MLLISCGSSRVDCLCAPPTDDHGYSSVIFYLGIYDQWLLLRRELNPSQKHWFGRQQERNVMNKKEEAINTPDQHYQSPEAVMLDNTLSDAEKKKILISWAEDEKALLRAQSESMGAPHKGDNATAAHILQNIEKAIEQL